MLGGRDWQAKPLGERVRREVEDSHLRPRLLCHGHLASVRRRYGHKRGGRRAAQRHHRHRQRHRRAGAAAQLPLRGAQGPWQGVQRPQLARDEPALHAGWRPDDDGGGQRPLSGGVVRRARRVHERCRGVSVN
jgi:hypothetical protein